MANKPMDILKPFMLQVPVDVERAIRSLKMRLRRDADLPDNIVGEIKPVGEIYEISSSVKDAITQQRFALAHELGHLILHRDLIGEGVDDTTEYRCTGEGNFYNNSIQKIHEMQANSFAANFLMPADLLRNELRKGSKEFVLVDLSEKFVVSEGAMEWRLIALGLWRRDEIDEEKVIPRTHEENAAEFLKLRQDNDQSERSREVSAEFFRSMQAQIEKR